MKNYRWLFLLTFILPLSLFCKKDEQPPTPPDGETEIQTKVLLQGLSQPWEIIYGPDNHIWFTERGGKISRLNLATNEATLLLSLPDIVAQGEGGLLGMTLHPDFSSSPYVYIVYNYRSGGNYLEKMVRYTYSSGSLSSPLILIDNIPAANTHNGSRLVIVEDKIFMSTGDAQAQASSQNTLSPNGKILRLNLDGSIPSDNPVAGNPYWSLGHRNPQGLVFANGKLYSSEHGPNTDDEINIIEKGRNYGWPTVNGFCDKPEEQSFCTTNNVREPLRAWTPTIATAGLDYYNHDEIPQWKNSLLLTTLKDQTLYQLKLDGSFTAITNVTTFFRNDYGRLRDVCISPQGKVYLCTGNGSNDKIIEISAK